MIPLFSVALLLLQAPASGIVQVAVNYGPRLNTLASGVAIADGRTILTDAGLLAKAREITVAYADGEIVDLDPGKLQQKNGVALLAIPQRHGDVVAVSPLASTPGEVEVDAFIGHAPKAFEVDRRPARARPSGAGAALRWQCTPQPPASARGGPLLDKTGRLIAVLVLEGGVLVGAPLPAVEMASAASAPTTATPASTTAKPPLAEATEPAPAPAPPPVDVNKSLFKDVPVRVTPPSIAKPIPPPTVPDLHLPLKMARLTWPKPKVTVAPKPPKQEKPKPEQAKTTTPAPSPSAPPPTAPAQNAAPSGPPGNPITFNPSEVVLRSRELSESKEYQKAVDLLEDAVHKHPEAPSLNFHLAIACWARALVKEDGTQRKTMDKTYYRKAIKAFDEFIAKAPSDPLIPDARMRLQILRSARYGAQ